MSDHAVPCSSDPALAALTHAGVATAEKLPPATRAWFAFLVLWLGATAAAAVGLLRMGDAGQAWALPAWVLALMCFYLSLCNSFVPLPTAWIVLLAAAPDYALVKQPVLNVALVSALATLATVVANLTEYHVLAYVLKFGLGRRIRRTRVYGWAVRWFDRAPFQLLTLIAFLPIPVDAVRWLAILRRYPRMRFALAYVLGRGPRYVLFAALSVLCALSPRAILIIQLAILAAALLGRLTWRLRTRAAGRRPHAQPDAAPAEVVATSPAVTVAADAS